ncbi:SCO family protein [Occallatibacter riparius]|uniref:SCO family protein n=1 Tax=Occallatibacter riparius TaxID=1002689 RepID=A0A9J7BU75_9BACT|nr:SCO family protein [Occallatibacter riparius]UWZ86207.1 SCO family protein [Occallatibacter riparius]
MQNVGTIRKRLLTGALSAAAAIVLVAGAMAPAMAQVSGYGDKQAGPANEKSRILDKVGISQHLDQQLPLNTTFTDDAGKQVELGGYFGKKPAILALVYYQCPMLCSEELNGLVSALLMVDEVPGRDFNIVVVSIDPSEGTDLAAAKKRSYVKRYGKPQTADGWHFLTGTQPNIDALTKAVGFGYTKIPGPDGKLTQFAHASAIQLVTPEGKLAQYYMGVEYSPKDLRLGLVESSHGKIGSPVDNILTYCYHYDPGTNKHSLIVARVVQLGGLVTMVSLGGFMFLMFRRDYRLEHEVTEKQDSGNDSGSKVNG